MTLTPEEYTDKLVEYCMLKVYAVATVTETDQVWGDELDFQAQKPTIDIQVKFTLNYLDVGWHCFSLLSQNPSSFKNKVKS